MLVESDRHTKPMSWRIDVYLLKLDGSRHMERLLDWNTRFPGGTISDNPVVSPDDRKIVIQLGFLAAQADGSRLLAVESCDLQLDHQR
jgi:Tol biopolymer transport system component